MRVVEIKDEDCINYKKISMFVALPFCSGKCYKELGLDCSICQNDRLRQSPIQKIDDEKIIERYLENSLTSAIVFGGLEPLDSFGELLSFIKLLRTKYNCHDDVVIYTGYREDEIEDKINLLKTLDNIVLKVGRYIPNDEPIFDKILGVTLASKNQYAKEINCKGE
ncbi:MAG: 4Fe-4S cluster-binding domain-containing protein [Christensenellales bacterium]